MSSSSDEIELYKALFELSGDAISIINFITAVILFLTGLILLSIMVQNMRAEISSILNVVLFIIGILPFLFSIFFIFVGIGLWTGKNWARISEIVISIITVVLSIISFIRGDFLEVFTIILFSLIAGYLLFNKDVKKTFS